MGCCNSIVVDAPVERVWSALRDFHRSDWAKGVIESLEVVGEAGPTTIGARRILNGVFHETLQALDDLARVLEYSIDDGPDAVSKDKVSGYVGRLQVFPVTATGQTFVLWTSRWSHSAGGVAELCNPIYTALLQAMRAHFTRSGL